MLGTSKSILIFFKLTDAFGVDEFCSDNSWMQDEKTENWD